MANMYCPNGHWIGRCGHVAGGLTYPSTLSGTCPTCRVQYSVTCPGNCLNAEMTSGPECGGYLPQ